jgi:uncharacterized membrane protein YphA (DoxX/SURF4 family)
VATVKTLLQMRGRNICPSCNNSSSGHVGQSVCPEKGPWMTALLMVSVELLGGFAVLVGAFIPIASIPLVITLLVAIFSVYLPNGFSSIKLQSVDATGAHFGQPGYETDLLYMAGLFAMVLGGSGRFALDRLLLRHLGLAEYSDLGSRNDRQDGSSELAGSEKQHWPSERTI